MRCKKKTYLLAVCLISYFVAFYSCQSETQIIESNDYSSLELAPFVEPDFPFITTSLDARSMAPGFPDTNVVSRGLAIQLGNDAYACFDTDLLRWSVGWTGDFLSLVLSAQVSYSDFFKENKDELPVVMGTPAVATGIYAGWSVETPAFQDTRPISQEVEGWRWGPVPVTTGRWNGAYVYGRSVVLAYTIGETEIAEMPGSEAKDGITVFTRTFRKGTSTNKMYLNVAEVRGGINTEITGNRGYIYQGAKGDTVTAVAVLGGAGTVKMFENRYATIEMPASHDIEEFTVVAWKGLAANVAKFDHILQNIKKTVPNYKEGGRSRWTGHVNTRGISAPDTAAFVLDRLMLPVPNQWKRNVRAADIGFFSNGDAAVSTYDGDVWIIEGIDGPLEKMKWRRYASGLFEPMSIEIVNDQIYVFGKEGIVRLLDLNGDGEADYYENFCNLMQQSVGVREWAADMVADKDGNFFIAKGGHITQYGDLLPYLSGTKAEHPWRASTNHSGSILKISPDGRTIEVVATGLRVPYLGINREKGIITASDQQGNFVPATPIYTVRDGDYFGVEVTRHRNDIPEIPEPILWIPHRVDRSGTSQTWIEGGNMGSLNNQMIHFSFGRPGAFRVILDSTSNTVQGGVVLMKGQYPAPIMKGETNPKDGQLYMIGFNNYASSAKGISSLLRLRYTEQPSYLVNGFQAIDKGIILSFDSELDENSLKPEHFRVKRWNYIRTEQYGSGHYKLDDTPGEETLPVQSAHLSVDKKHVLMVIPGMDKAEQVEISYDIQAAGGKSVKDEIWLTVKDVSSSGLKGFSITDEDLSTTSVAGTTKPDEPASLKRGYQLFQQIGCSGCHSPYAKTMGMYGPPFGKIYGTVRQFEDGTSATVDEAYLAESILEPSKKVVKGYDSQMPSYLGILSDTDIESIILYIKTL